MTRSRIEAFDLLWLWEKAVPTTEFDAAATD
jgi:hypothetical protein